MLFISESVKALTSEDPFGENKKKKIFLFFYVVAFQYCTKKNLGEWFQFHFPFHFSQLIN